MSLQSIDITYINVITINLRGDTAQKNYIKHETKKWLCVCIVAIFDKNKTTQLSYEFAYQLHTFTLLSFVNKNRADLDWQTLLLSLLFIVYKTKLYTRLYESEYHDKKL